MVCQRPQISAHSLGLGLGHGLGHGHDESQSSGKSGAVMSFMPPMAPVRKPVTE